MNTIPSLGARNLNIGLNTGAPGGIRTHNLLIRSQALYPLSYGGFTEAIIPENLGFDAGIDPKDLVALRPAAGLYPKDKGNRFAIQTQSP